MICNVKRKIIISLIIGYFEIFAINKRHNFVFHYLVIILFKVNQSDRKVWLRLKWQNHHWPQLCSNTVLPIKYEPHIYCIITHNENTTYMISCSLHLPGTSTFSKSTLPPNIKWHIYKAHTHTYVYMYKYTDTG